MTGTMIFGWVLLLAGQGVLTWLVMSVADTTDDDVESAA